MADTIPKEWDHPGVRDHPSGPPDIKNIIAYLKNHPEAMSFIQNDKSYESITKSGDGGSQGDHHTPHVFVIVTITKYECKI